MEGDKTTLEKEVEILVRTEGIRDKEGKKKRRLLGTQWE